MTDRQDKVVIGSWSERRAHACTGGVFEDAIMIASMLLEKGADITETVRVAGHIDEVFQASSSPAPPHTAHHPPTICNEAKCNC